MAVFCSYLALDELTSHKNPCFEGVSVLLNPSPLENSIDKGSSQHRQILIQSLSNGSSFVVLHDPLKILILEEVHFALEIGNLSELEPFIVLEYLSAFDPFGLVELKELPKDRRNHFIAFYLGSLNPFLKKFLANGSTGVKFLRGKHGRHL